MILLWSKAWNRGERHEVVPAWSVQPSKEAAEKYVERLIAAGASSAMVGPIREDGSCVVHCHPLAWGLGVTRMVDDDFAAGALSLSIVAERLEKGR